MNPLSTWVERGFLFLAELAGPTDSVVDDLEDVVQLVSWVRFVSGSEVEDSTDSFALTDTLAGAGGELGVDSLSDGPDQAAGEGFVSDAEEGLEDHLLGGRHVERRAVHLFGFDDEVVNAFGNRVPGGADSDRLAVIRFTPATLEVSGTAEDGFEGLAIVARVEANEAHSLLVNLGFDHVGDFVVDFAVAGVAPPNEDVGVVEDFLSDALVLFVEVSDFDFEFCAGVEGIDSGFDRSVEAVGIDFEGTVLGVFVPNQDSKFVGHRLRL